MNQQLEFLNTDNSMKTHGRSFFWGTLFMPRPMVTKIEVLYRFLRAVDDIVDDRETVPAEKKAQLVAIEKSISCNDETHPVVGAFRALAREESISEQEIADFFLGMKTDLQNVRIQNGDELLQYAYQVAGVVGQMMFRLLDVKGQQFEKNAVQLGIAMQLTNICRDVVEDGKRDRVYLPNDRVPSDVVTGYCAQPCERAERQIRFAVGEILEMAEVYYSSGMGGLKGIPWRGRFGVLVAARLYRAIGRKIVRRGASSIRYRVYVSWPEKILQILGGVIQFIGVSLGGRQRKRLRGHHNLTVSGKPATWLID